MVRGRIFLIPFPFDDLSGTKVRPVVCLTNPIGIHRHVVVAFISSRIPEKTNASDVILLKDDPKLSDSGLKKDSVILLHRLLTIHEGMLQRELGYLPAHVMDDILNKLVRLFKGDM